LTCCPTATYISDSLPELLKLSGTLAGFVTGPVALTVVCSVPWLTAAVWKVAAC
jgi:hypothetical protein